MPRIVEIAVALMASFILALPMLLIAFAIKMTSKGPVLHWSSRIGRDNRPFAMPKFRTMKLGTPNVASDLLTNRNDWLTAIGPFLRRSSVDELPQLWCILTGQMSIVGPRPALFNQHDLVDARTRNGVFRLRPGLTGWAQVNGRDDLQLVEKVALDHFYLQRRSLRLDFEIIVRTFSKVLTGSGVSH
jgi:O-antigen biosynthesis protein WbqP